MDFWSIGYNNFNLKPATVLRIPLSRLAISVSHRTNGRVVGWLLNGRVWKWDGSDSCGALEWRNVHSRNDHRPNIRPVLRFNGKWNRGMGGWWNRNDAIDTSLYWRFVDSSYVSAGQLYSPGGLHA